MAVTVNMIESEREKDLPGKGTFVSYKLTVQDGTREVQGVELFQKKDSVPPKVGETYENWKVEDSQYGKKIKKEPRTGVGGFRPRDPRETAAIQRQHSQEMAVRVASAAGWFEGLNPETPAGQDKLKLVARLSDWFQRDIQRGVNLEQYGSSKEEVRKDPKRTGASDVPADAGEFVHEPQSLAGTPWET